MSTSMPANVIIKVLKKFDKDADVRIGKSANGYGSGIEYTWNFRGQVDGHETLLKLQKSHSGRFTLKRIETQIVEEIVQREKKTETEENI